MLTDLLNQDPKTNCTTKQSRKTPRRATRHRRGDKYQNTFFQRHSAKDTPRFCKVCTQAPAPASALLPCPFQRGTRSLVFDGRKHGSAAVCDQLVRNPPCQLTVSHRQRWNQRLAYRNLPPPCLTLSSPQSCGHDAPQGLVRPQEEANRKHSSRLQATARRRPTQQPRREPRDHRHLAPFAILPHHDCLGPPPHT